MDDRNFTTINCCCTMRRRYDLQGNNRNYDISNDAEDGGSDKNKRSIYGVPPYVPIIFLLILFGMGYAIFLVDQILPVPLTLSDEKTHPNDFIAERAHSDLKELTDLGPRVVGGYENEVLTVDLLTRKINEIISKSNEKQKIEIDIQTVSGGHFLNYTTGGKILGYSNLQNIVVKLYSSDEHNTSLLINSHFDSVPTSPGGSDDGINVVTMLEVLRKLSKESDRPRNNIIFLFNGAEETSLQAAHGFITQHKWAKECKVVINLDAAGHGGKIILFQTGPRASWLMNYYVKVPHPYGQAMGEEIFQSGIIPSDTDFRIFRDYGGLVGYDMAFYRKGYRYHTKFDDFKHIPLGSIQHVGDNVLHLVRSLSNAEELDNPKEDFHRSIYYDIFGIFMIYYPTFIGRLINLAVSLLSVGTYILSTNKLNCGITFGQTMYSLLATLGSFILTGFVIFIISYLIDLSGYCMSWYGNPILIIGLYVVPTVALSGCLLRLVKPINAGINIHTQTQVQIVRLFWTSWLFVGSVVGFRSMYIFMIPVLFNTLGFIVIHVFQLHRSVKAWQIIYVVFNLLGSVQTIRCYLSTMELFVPITGRMGPDKNADFIIGFMAMLLTIFTVTPFVALISIIRNIKWVFIVLGGIFLFTLIIVFSPLGFPYSGNPDEPTPQRYWVIHTSRMLRAENGTERTDAGYFLLNMDRNSPNFVRPYVNELSRSRRVLDDCKYLVCGLPLAHGKMVNIMQYSTWVPAVHPQIPSRTTLEVLSKKQIEKNTVQYKVSISGPDRIGVYLSAKSGFNVTAINLIERMPREKENYHKDGRPVYFMIHIFGKQEAPFVFEFDVRVPDNYDNETTTELAFSGIYVHTRLNQHVPDYNKFLKQFPDWADVTAWIGSYENVWM